LATSFASLLFQLVLGLFLTWYDQRISMATGYLWPRPESIFSQDLTGIFNNQSFTGMTLHRLPTPWSLLLGGIYRLSYAIIPNLLVYNLAIKLPIIAANIALAYLVRGLIKERTSNEVISHRAWIFLLFNPYLLYFTAAWGQFDSLVALCTLLSLVLLDKDHDVALPFSWHFPCR
jgi:hypothetical protein